MSKWKNSFHHETYLTTCGIKMLFFFFFHSFFLFRFFLWVCADFSSICIRKWVAWGYVYTYISGDPFDRVTMSSCPTDAVVPYPNCWRVHQKTSNPRRSRKSHCFLRLSYMTWLTLSLYCVPSNKVIIENKESEMKSIWLKEIVFLIACPMDICSTIYILRDIQCTYTYTYIIGMYMYKYYIYIYIWYLYLMMKRKKKVFILVLALLLDNFCYFIFYFIRLIETTVKKISEQCKMWYRFFSIKLLRSNLFFYFSFSNTLEDFNSSRFPKMIVIIYRALSIF